MQLISNPCLLRSIILTRRVWCSGSLVRSATVREKRMSKQNALTGTPGEQETSLTRQNSPGSRQIDLCALCHAGPGNPRAPAFSFVPGANLAKYVAIPDDPADTPVDVHGHQVQLLESSRCFRSSNMTCTTCHDVHTQQRDVAYFSERCLTCHKAESCGKYAPLGTGDSPQMCGLPHAVAGINRDRFRRRWPQCEPTSPQSPHRSLLIASEVAALREIRTQPKTYLDL